METRSDVARVLVVDDDPQIVWVLSSALTTEGYAVQTAVDGDSGLAIVADWRPALVLIDVHRSPAVNNSCSFTMLYLSNTARVL